MKGERIPWNQAPEITPAKPSQLVHLQLDVRKFLAAAQPQDFERTFVGPEGQALDWRAARQLLLAELQLGHNFLPVGDRCDQFDYSTGCAGHDL